jgi:hypothetical protein
LFCCLNCIFECRNELTCWKNLGTSKINHSNLYIQQFEFKTNITRKYSKTKKQKVKGLEGQVPIPNNNLYSFDKYSKIISHFHSLALIILTQNPYMTSCSPVKCAFSSLISHICSLPSCAAFSLTDTQPSLTDTQPASSFEPRGL